MILSLVTEEDIFKLVVDEVVLDGVKKYQAPYRDDNKADCYFNIGRTGVLHFVDFADTLIRKDCFGFIGACYKLDYDSTLRYIDQVMNLNICTNSEPIQVLPIQKTSTYKVNKKQKVIEISPRKFDNRDRGFWWSYGISRSDLISDGVIPINCYRFDNRKDEKVTITTFDICYAYTEFANNKMKIYRPMGSSEQKWLTNCNQNDIGSIKHLDFSADYVVITKSYKDCRVLRNEGLNSIWFQNEGMLPSVEYLTDILLFNKIYIWFDNDPAGLAASNKVKEYLTELGHSNITQIIIPTNYRTDYGVKDPADLRKHDSEKLKEIINKKIHSV